VYLRHVQIYCFKKIILWFNLCLLYVENSSNKINICETKITIQSPDKPQKKKSKSYFDSSDSDSEIEAIILRTNEKEQILENKTNLFLHKDTNF